MKPPAEESPPLSILIAIARMPLGRIADMNPPVPVLTSLSRRIGSPRMKATLVIDPFTSSMESALPDLVIMNSETAAFGQSCQLVAPSLTTVPIGRSSLATSTCSMSTLGATTMGRLVVTSGDRDIRTYVAPNANIAMAPTINSLRFMGSQPLNADSRRSGFRPSNRQITVNVTYPIACPIVEQKIQHAGVETIESRRAFVVTLRNCNNLDVAHPTSYVYVILEFARLY